MSEIIATPFQIKGRANTINVRPEEMQDLNSKITQISETHGVHFDYFKDLFNFLMDYAISGESSNENQAEIERLKAVHAEQMDGMRKSVNDNYEAKQRLESELNELKDAQFQKELEVSMSLEDKLIVPCTPEQRELLEAIANNRLEANYETTVPGEADSAAEIIKKIAFRHGYLHNHFGIFHTGL